jgi:hypothetical protein
MAELPQPDMSHLTPEERRIIENVLMRQKEEEKQDIEAMRYATDSRCVTLARVCLRENPVWVAGKTCGPLPQCF